MRNENTLLYILRSFNVLDECGKWDMIFFTSMNYFNPLFMLNFSITIYGQE